MHHHHRTSQLTWTLPVPEPSTKTIPNLLRPQRHLCHQHLFQPLHVVEREDCLGIRTTNRQLFVVLQEANRCGLNRPNNSSNKKNINKASWFFLWIHFWVKTWGIKITDQINNCLTKSDNHFSRSFWQIKGKKTFRFDQRHQILFPIISFFFVDFYDFCCQTRNKKENSFICLNCKRETKNRICIFGRRQNWSENFFEAGKQQKLVLELFLAR